MIESTLALQSNSRPIIHHETESNSSNTSNSREPFYTFHAQTGKNRLISSFEDLLNEKLEQVSNQNPFVEEPHIREDAEDAYNIVNGLTDDIQQVRDQLRYLGLHKNIKLDGQNHELIEAIIKADNFGRVLGSEKPNKKKNNQNPTITTNILDTKITLPEERNKLDTHLLEAAITKITANPALLDLQSHYEGEQLDIINWAARQAIIRQLLPKEPLRPARHFDLSQMEFVRNFSGGGSTSETFQASNPSSIYRDKKTGRLFVVKQCPTPTLKADHFGLQVLEMHGVPTYEYGLTTDEHGKISLVSGFLDGYQDTADVIDFPPETPPEIKKTVIPEWLTHQRAMQRGILAEIIIGEYNTKAHNLMVLGEQSFVHLDQGGALTSTASGKYKSFNPELGIEDIQDVLHCYTDLDPNSQEVINSAYAQIAEVVDGKLIIKDVNFARQLLDQERRIPIEAYDQALELAGFKDGEESIQELEYRIRKIDDELLPRYRAMPESRRKEQYIRWMEGAKNNYQTAIIMGGELSFYKHAIRQRRDRLLGMWEEAIFYAETKHYGWETMTRQEVRQLKDRWWSAWDTVVKANNGQANVYATATVFVESLSAPYRLKQIGVDDRKLTTAFSRFPKPLSPKEKLRLITHITNKVKRAEVPLSSKEAIPTLRRLTDQGFTRVWTTGDVDATSNHSLSPNLIGDTLPGSGQQLWKLASTGIGDLRRDVGRNKLGIEAHNNKFSELPRILDEYKNQGVHEIVIIDDSFSSLDTAAEIIHQKDPSVKVHFILVNQGRKRTTEPQQLQLRNKNQHYHIIDHFDEAPGVINQYSQAKKNDQPIGILCDFDGVITDNTAVRTRQEDIVYQEVLGIMQSPPDLEWKNIRELTEEDFTYEKVINNLRVYRDQGYKIILTNGVFDLLHPGHVDYLQQALNAGGKKAVLVVGLNSDNSAKNQGKTGPERPIVSQLARAQTLKGLESVTEVVIFDDTTADQLLERIKPDIYVKGGDYSLSETPEPGKRTLPERETLERLNIAATFIPTYAGNSTSAIIEKIIGRS